MKTTKTNSKSENSSKNTGPAKSKKVAIRYMAPGEEEIRAKASEIYHQRIELGEEGTPENDWFEAENYLKETVV